MIQACNWYCDRSFILWISNDKTTHRLAYSHSVQRHINSNWRFRNYAIFIIVSILVRKVSSRLRRWFLPFSKITMDFDRRNNSNVFHSNASRWAMVSKHNAVHPTYWIFTVRIIYSEIWPLCGSNFSTPTAAFTPLSIGLITGFLLCENVV